MEVIDNNDNYEYKNEIEQEIEKLTNLSLNTQKIKERVLNKLVSSIDKMSLDLDNESNKSIEAKSSIINNFISLASDLEKQRRDTIKFKAKYETDKDIQDNVSELVTNMLNKFNINDSNNKSIKEYLNKVNDDEIVNNRIENENIEILDEEINPNKNEETINEIINKYNIDIKKE